MEVDVRMSAEDFMEFMEWKKDRLVNEHRTQEVVKNMENLANMILRTLVECGESDEAEYKIESQDDARALVGEAVEVF